MSRRVLVTGGSRGIGRAICEAFAAQGDRVAVHSTKGTGLELRRDRDGCARAGRPCGDGVRGQSPAGRVAAPEEVAAAVLFLAGAQSFWSTGAVLDVSGASYLRT